jgi:rubredoxin
MVADLNRCTVCGKTYAEGYAGALDDSLGEDWYAPDCEGPKGDYDSCPWFAGAEEGTLHLALLEENEDPEYFALIRGEYQAYLAKQKP